MASIICCRDAHAQTRRPHRRLLDLFFSCPLAIGVACPAPATRQLVARGIREGAITWHAVRPFAPLLMSYMSVAPFVFTCNCDKSVVGTHSLTK